MKEHFFDLTASSRGVLASVRTGHLKKDLSLLFEKRQVRAPAGFPYRFSSGDVREPSIRPMSPEIADRAVLKERHFASWTRMRHFYRMYRQDSDAEARPLRDGGTDGSARAQLGRLQAWTDCNINRSCLGLGRSGYLSPFSGSHQYHLYPESENRTALPAVAMRANMTCVMSLRLFAFIGIPTTWKCACPTRSWR